MKSGLALKATAEAAGAAALVRARTGPATSAPTVPMVRITGAITLRRIRMIFLHAFTEVNCLELGIGGPTDCYVCLFLIRQSEADYLSYINRKGSRIQIVKQSLLFAMAPYE